MKREGVKKILLAVLTAAFVIASPLQTALPTMINSVEAAAKPPASATVTCGKTISVAVDNATKYTSSNKKIATVSSKGVVTGKKTGKVTITIKTKKKTYKTKVTVTKKKAVISVDAKSLKLAVDEKITLKAKCEVKLSYKAKNKNIKVDYKGKITALKKGTSSITISGKSTTSYTAPKSVVVKVTVTDPEINIVYGKTASVKTKGATKYSSSNTKIITVDKKGTITPVKAGKASVSVKVGKTTKKYIIIVEKADSTIKVDKTSVEVQKGKTLQLKATAKSSLTYKADNSNITVDSKGKITGKKAGTAVVTISGKSTDCYKAPKAIKVKVTVKEAPKLPSSDPESAMEVYTGPKTPEAFLQVCNNVASLIVKDGNWIYSNSNNKSTLAEAREKSRVTNCAHYVSMCMQQFGTMPKGYSFYSNDEGELVFKPNHLPAEDTIMEEWNKYYTIIKTNGQKPSELNLQPGDICCYKGHVNVFAGKNSDGKYTWYDFAASGTSDGKKESGYFVRVLKTGNTNMGIYTIIRLKK